MPLLWSCPATKNKRRYRNYERCARPYTLGADFSLVNRSWKMDHGDVVRCE